MRKQRPAGPLAVDIRVRSHVGAEVVWACWQGDATPAQFQVVEVRGSGADGTGRREGRQRLVGEGDVLTGMDLAENGWETPQRYIQDAKRALWKKVVPPNRAIPVQFGPAEDETLRKFLYLECEALQRQAHYLSVDKGQVHDPLNDPAVLAALSRDIHLPILFIDERENDLFQLAEDDLQILIEKCIDLMEPRPR